MSHYVDGFVICVPKKAVAAYKRIALRAAKVWIDHGALEVRECAGEDLSAKFGVPFPKLAKSKKNETVIFSWIVFKSRASRDRVNAKVMKDPRVADIDPKSMPFDCSRMSYGGFTTLVKA